MAAFQWRPHACNTAVLSHASHAPCAHAVLHQSFCPAASACSHRACGGSSRACTGAPSLSVQLRLHAIIAHGEVTHIEGRFLDTLLGFAWGLKGDVRHGRGVHGQSRQGACICTSEDARSMRLRIRRPASGSVGCSLPRMIECESGWLRSTCAPCAILTVINQSSQSGSLLPETTEHPQEAGGCSNPKPGKGSTPMWDLTLTQLFLGVPCSTPGICSMHAPACLKHVTCSHGHLLSWQAPPCRGAGCHECIQAEHNNMVKDNPDSHSERFERP